MMAKECAPAGTLAKPSIMLGCGEIPDQVVSTMEKVRAAGCSTICRYLNVLLLRPSRSIEYLGMDMVCVTFLW